MYLNNISNYFFGISKLNILYSIAKKFVFVGNIFLPSKLFKYHYNCQKKTKLSFIQISDQIMINY